MPKRKKPSIDQLLQVMAKLRSPEGCPWDREQDHMTLRFHAVEEVYELMDAIESGDDQEMLEELGDLLLQVVFHCQLAQERGAFDFEKVASVITEKLIRRHPHVFGDSKAATVDAVWAQWEQIKKAEKAGTKHDRPSALDGVPRSLPALLRAEKLVKKAVKANLHPKPQAKKQSKGAYSERLFDLVAELQSQGLSAEELLRAETNKREKAWRKAEKQRGAQ
ncbi:MAG TPA: MazG family protein [Methylomirabilota bacterium]|nr:MazG family protein [Methylomirabilota bacterium]